MYFINVNFFQVYISYGSNIYDTKEYKLNKQKIFNFECNCVACINDWPTVTDVI